MSTMPTQNRMGLLAQGNPMLDIGLGLLSASGPSLMSVSLGQAMAQGSQFASHRDRERVQNQFMRDKMEQQKLEREARQRQSEARDELTGLLTGMPAMPMPGEGQGMFPAESFEGTPGILPDVDPQTAGLLFEAYPELGQQVLQQTLLDEPSELEQKVSTMEGLLGRQLDDNELLSVGGISTDDRKTTLMRNAEFIFDESVPIDQRKFALNQLEEDSNDDLRNALDLSRERVALLSAQFELEQNKRKAQEEGDEKAEESAVAEGNFITQVERDLEAGDRLDALEGTVGAPGAFSNVRSAGIGVGSFLGQVDPELETSLQRFQELAGREGIDQVSGFKGTITDQKFDFLTGIGLSMDKNPDANRLVLLDRYEAALEAHKSGRVKLPDNVAKELQERVSRFKSLKRRPQASANELSDDDLIKELGLD